MKTLELKLKKDVLIVDENDFGYYTNIDNEIIFHLGNVRLRRVKGNFKLLCKGSELTEEIASELVEMEYSVLYKKSFFIDYDRPSLLLKFAKESFISAVESKGFHWLENPIEKPINYDLWSKYGDYTQYGKKLTKECLKWQEAEEKTFKNPLIFVKKS